MPEKKPIPMKMVFSILFRKTIDVHVKAPRFWLFSLFVIFANASQMYAGEVVNGYPSQILAAPSASLKTIRELVSSTGDFRELFSSSNVLTDRILRSVCILDASNSYKGEIKEVPVSTEVSLKELLEQANVKPWRGSPTLKVFKKRAILQSPASSVSAGDKAAIEDFLNIKIEPGDLVYFGFTF